MDDLKFRLYDSEIFVLIHLLNDRAFFARTYKHIKPEYFSDIKLGIIYRYICKYFLRYKKLPSRIILETISKKDTSTNKIKDLIIDAIDQIHNDEVKKRVDVKFIEDEVVDFIKKARIIEAMEESQRELENGEFDGIVSRMRDAVYVDIDKNLGLQFSNVDERYARMSTLLEENAVSSGYKNLDKALDGGFYPKEIVIFAAPYGTYKSTFMNNIAVNLVKQGKKVVLYTLEMSEERYFTRFDSCLLRLNKYTVLREKELVIPKVRKKIEEYGGDIIIKEFPASTETVDSFEFHLDELETFRGFTPDVVLVDYLGLIRPRRTDSGKNGTYLAGKAQAEELRNFAKLRGIPIITAHQMNRDALDNDGGTRELITGRSVSESYAILNTTDNFFTINQTAAERGKGEARLYGDKCRNSVKGGIIHFNIDYSCLRFDERLELTDIDEEIEDAIR